MHDMDIILELSKLRPSVLKETMQSMSLEERKNLISNSYLSELSSSVFIPFLSELSYDEAKVVLENPKLYHRILTTPKNSLKRSMLNIIERQSMPVLKAIFESKYLAEYQEQFYDYIDSINYDKFQELLDQVDFSSFISSAFSNFDDAKLQDRLGHLEIHPDIIHSFLQKTHLGQLNPMGILKVKNEKELLLYTKFGLLVPVMDDQDITLEKGLVLPYSTIFNVKEGNINKLIQLLREKGNSTPEDLLEVSLKLYYIFGFDNARKIILDKFTNLTPSAITRIINLDFKNHRREYRTKHQERFYHFEMIEEVIHSLRNDQHEVFANLLYQPNDLDIAKVEREFAAILSRFEDTDVSECYDAIKTKIMELINQREALAKDVYSLEVNARLQKKTPRKLSVLDLKKLFHDVSLIHIIQDCDSNILSKLQTFLLGNAKANNDCLFRLIVNQEALGLNRLLGRLINQYDIIDSIAQHNHLSLNSILDVMDIVRTGFFSLKPNEEDIMLTTIAKIISSKEYCNADDTYILNGILKLHVDRKKKVYASIPTVKGEYKNYSYQVVPFDAEYLLSAGVTAQNCLRISGLGEDFFRYCLTSNQAVMMYLTNKETEDVYVCPIIRSGNGIHCNGIDPVMDDSQEDDVIETFSVAMREILAISEKESRPDEKIEVATMADLHLKKYFKEHSFESYQLDVAIPIDYNCYTDYNKVKIEHYVMAKSNTYHEKKYYVSKDKFYQERGKNYEFDIAKEYDQERLSKIVNSIAYSAIDFKNISEDKKNHEKRMFKPVDVSSFQYIVGNKDWYIAIDNQFNVLANLLPYDDRAKKDYLKYLSKIPSVLEEITSEEKEYGNDRNNSKKNK